MKMSKKILSCLLVVLVLVSFSFISSAKTPDKASENNSRCLGYIIYMFTSDTDSDEDYFATGTDYFATGSDSFSTETDGFATGTDSGNFCSRVKAFFRNIINTIIDFFTRIFVRIGLN